MDLTKIEGEFMVKPVYCLMMMAWGIVADVDISSEVIRFMGNSRITIFAVLKILQDISYQCKFAYNGMSITNKNQEVPKPEELKT